jgi:hypothetical protein
MKQIFGSIALCLIAYSIGKYSPLPNFSSFSPSIAGTIGTEAEYRIEYTGRAGSKLNGNYSIAETTTDINQLAAISKKPVRVEN